jgi:hypothetical protein
MSTIGCTELMLLGKEITLCSNRIWQDRKQFAILTLVDDAASTDSCGKRVKLEVAMK